MSVPVAHHRYTFKEYIDLEEIANIKHEFVAGEIYALAGGTPEHAALAANLCAALVGRVSSRGCRVFTSDLRLRVLATGLAAYPDVTVACRNLERDPENPNTVTNPVLVVEVTSDGTEDYDHGEKLEHYKQIPSLKHYLLVSHREARVEAWSREGVGDWVCRTETTGGTVVLEAVDCEVPVNEIYRGWLHGTRT